MFGQTELTIVAAIATLVLPAMFLATLAVAGVWRSRGQAVGERLSTTVTVLGGASLGVMLLFGDLRISWPILAAIVLLAGLLLRGGRLRSAAWFVAGAAAPWAILGGISVIALLLGAPGLEPVQSWLGFMAGAVPLLGALVLATAQRLPELPASGKAATGRSFGDVGAAVRAPALVGPFGLSEVALLVAVVMTWFVLGLLLPAGTPQPIRLSVLVVVGAILGAEAYIRAMPGPAREAFEAFSWLGEWEIAQVRALTHEGVPTNELAARRWLRVHPETPESRWIRVEMLTFAKRYDEARAVVDRMSTDTPEDQFDRAAAADFVDWFSGGDGDIDGLEAAAAELRPADGDPRLRAEVAIATARVRRRMAAGEDPLQAGAPLREARKRSGAAPTGRSGERCGSGSSGRC